jgi:fructose-bisphosphate aldolase class II
MRSADRRIAMADESAVRVTDHSNMPIASRRRYGEMLDAARAGGFAYPAINVTSSDTLNAALTGFAEAGSDGIVQITAGGAGALSGGGPGHAVAGHGGGGGAAGRGGAPGCRAARCQPA